MTARKPTRGVLLGAMLLCAAPALATDYYVTNAGSDSNDGESADAPFATLAAAEAVATTGDTIYLRCGDVWEEGWGGAATGIHFAAYGAGPKPLLDGTKLVNNWSLTGTNTYTASVALAETLGSTRAPFVFENGKLLLRVTSEANCESTAGSYYMAASDMTSSPVSVIIHPTGTTSPLTNGREYRVTNRVYGIEGAASATNIAARGFGYNNGVYADEVSGVEAYGFGKHNIFGTTLVEDCVAIDAESQFSAGASTLFVIFQNNGTGQTGTFRNCIAAQRNGFINNGAFAGFFSHDSVSQRGYDSIVVENCSAINLSSAVGGDMDSMIIRDLWVDGCVTGFTAASYNLSIHAARMRLYRPQIANNNLSGPLMMLSNSFTYTNETSATSTPLFNVASGGNLTCTNCTFYSDTSSAVGSAGRNMFTSTGPLTLRRCVFFGRPGVVYSVNVFGTSYTGDFNIFYSKDAIGGLGNVALAYNGSGYTTLATWKAATGQDTNSVYLTPAQAADFWLNDPATGDWRINPSAQVTGSDGTVYNGTFADGVTPITAAGCQSPLPTEWPTIANYTAAQLQNFASLTRIAPDEVEISQQVLATIKADSDFANLLARVDEAISSRLAPTDAGRTLDVNATGEAGADIVRISGDATAADNLEAYSDGTTPQPVNATQVEGGDATDQVRDSLVDDATRIDASALNTASVTTIPAIVADTAELQTDWANGGRLDLLLDTTITQTAASWIRNAIGLAAANLDIQLDGITSISERDARDLEPVAHVWQLKRQGDGTLRSTNPLYLPPDTTNFRAGWNVEIPAILPPGTVIDAQSDPELVTATDDVTLAVTHIGHGEKVAKVEFDIASDAEATDDPDTDAIEGHWIKTTITNSNGGGPIPVYGLVVIQGEPE